MTCKIRLHTHSSSLARQFRVLLASPELRRDNLPSVGSSIHTFAHTYCIQPSKLKKLPLLPSHPKFSSCQEHNRVTCWSVLLTNPSQTPPLRLFSSPHRLGHCASSDCPALASYIYLSLTPLEFVYSCTNFINSIQQSSYAHFHQAHFIPHSSLFLNAHFLSLLTLVLLHRKPIETA